MRTASLLLSLLMGIVAGDVFAQSPAPAPAKPAPTQTKPAPAPAKPAAARPAPAGRSGMAITVTTARGATIPGVQVQVIGTTERNGVTDASGQVNFPGLPAGTYRLRFNGDDVTAFEREVTLRAGAIADLDITLTPAPPRPETPPPAPAPAPAAAPVGPAGQPQVLSVVDLVERELISGSQARKDTLIACSGNTRTMLVQLNQNQAQRVYEGAESTYYVVAGEGSVALNGRDVGLTAGGYASIPRGTPHAIARKGRRPLILLAILSGEPCEEAR